MTAPVLSPPGEMVRTGDPDRFLSALTAPAEGRERLFALYAFNLEIARAPYVVSDPMLGEIRLTWWREAIAEIYDNASPRRHEVVEPLAELIRATRAPRLLFDNLIEARRRDLYPDPMPDRAAFDAYVTATAGGLMDLSMRALGVARPAIAEDAGYAMGVANMLLAKEALESKGRRPFPAEEGPRSIARDALKRLSRARAMRGETPCRAAPALLAAWRAGRILRLAALADDAPATADLAGSPFYRRASLLARAATGYW